MENNNVNVKLFHPKGPASKYFCLSRADVCWVSAESVICEVNPPETFLKTVIYRIYS